MKVIIVGAGIAGLTTALCLHRQNIDCEVFEQSDEVRELGVGLNLLPHAVQRLADLGLLADLKASAVATYELILMNRLGQEIRSELRGRAAGQAVPQLSIHRGVLQRVLYDAVCHRIGRGAVRTDRRLVSFDDGNDAGGGVRARFVDRRGRPAETAEGDVLVAADGIHSSARTILHPAEGPPRWNGVMMWRGATDWPAFLTGRSMIVAGGTDAKLVVYPIKAGGQPETRLTNWAVVSRVGDDGDHPPRREDWSRLGAMADLEPLLSHFTIDGIDVRGMVHATPRFYEYPMCDRDPLDHWGRGRVTLIGDAAHPMYPMGSNGASQAIIDADVLTSALAAAPAPEALRAYEHERLPATAEIVRLNRAGGPERIIDLVEARAPGGFQNLADVVNDDELGAILGGYARATSMTADGAS